MNPMRTIPCLIVLCFSLLGCSDDPDDHIVSQEGNKTVVHSSRIDSLKKLINLQFLEPINVEYEYVFYDNSATNERIGVPGPSDFFLQAVLEYDSLGITEVIRTHISMSIRRPQYDHSEFEFKWLNKRDRADLDWVGGSIKGSPAIMYAKQPLINGGYIIAERKVFLILSNN